MQLRPFAFHDHLMQPRHQVEIGQIDVGAAHAEPAEHPGRGIDAGEDARIGRCGERRHRDAEAQRADADVLLLPLAGMVAPRYEDLHATTAAAIVRFFDESARALRFVNYLGLPALAMPCGLVEGMPVGLQLVGRPLREDTLFALGAALQRATGWHDAAPASPR